MNGFFKRDCYLVSGNLRFYILFVAAFGLLTAFTDFNSGFLSIYLLVFAMSSLMGLFSYDDFNHWMAYGAAAPAGRQVMVKARYLLTALVAVGIAVLQLLLSLLGKEEGGLYMAAVFGGGFLLYASVTLPVCYRFGGTKARTVMILIVAVLAALVGMGGAVMNISSGGGSLRLPPATLFLPLPGLAALALSYRLSLGIMRRREL